jgi:hypothetical protein
MQKKSRRSAGQFVSPLILVWGALGISCLVSPSTAAAQNKPTRSTPPEFKQGQFKGVFFDDLASVLRGPFPDDVQRPLEGTSNAPPRNDSIADRAESPNTQGSPSDIPWKSLISPASLEDLVKGAKLRLDSLVTTPAAFAGGGFQEARKEFSLQALLFAIIEVYPADVRWKGSAAVARESMSRVAMNSTVGSRQVYDEAKKRLLDLEDLLNGSKLTGESRTEAPWHRLMDRGPLMQLLEWAHQEHITPSTANQAQFNANKSELQRYAELVAVLGQVSILEEMPDAKDNDYQAYAREMIAQAQAIVLAVQSNDAELARQASGRLGQSCSTCHENFR